MTPSNAAVGHGDRGPVWVLLRARVSGRRWAQLLASEPVPPSQLEPVIAAGFSVTEAVTAQAGGSGIDKSRQCSPFGSLAATMEQTYGCGQRGRRLLVGWVGRGHRRGGFVARDAARVICRRSKADDPWPVPVPGLGGMLPAQAGRDSGLMAHGIDDVVVSVIIPAITVIGHIFRS